MLADHPALGQERPDIAVDSACWHPPAADGGHRLNTETLRARQQYPAPRFMVPLPRLDSYSQRYLPNTGRITRRSYQTPRPTAVLIQNAALNQRPEVLLQRIATGARQLDDFAHSDTAMLSGKLDNLQ